MMPTASACPTLRRLEGHSPRYGADEGPSSGRLTKRWTAREGGRLRTDGPGLLVDAPRAWVGPLRDRAWQGAEERGQAAGMSAKIAEQFMSAVHERATGNCSTMVIGRSGSAELADRACRFLDPAVKANITRL